MKVITKEMADAIQKVLDVPGVEKSDVENLVLLCCKCGYDQAKGDWEKYNEEAVSKMSRIIH